MFRSLSGRKLDVEPIMAARADRSKCTPEFISKVNKRRAKNKVAKKTRKGNR